MRRAFVTVLLLGLVSMAMAKTGRTYFTPERIAAARENVAKYEWAQAQFAQIMNAPIAQYNMMGPSFIGAKNFDGRTDDQLFAMMPPITLSRIYDKHTVTECPVHAKDIARYSGYYPWKVDFFNHPYQVQCPVGGEWYPSNDFAAGDMTSGDYPDNAEGYVDGENKWNFINYYVHAAYGGLMVPGIHGLSMAYLLTDDTSYAHRAAVLLAALAEQFPGKFYNSEFCRDKPYGHRSGLITDYIWENIKLVDLARAYDAIYPIYDEDPELVAYLKSKGCVDPDAPNDAAGARAYVEDHIFRQAMQALLDVAIQGNPGHHQLAALTIGLVMDNHSDEHPNTPDVVHGAYYNGYAPAAWLFTNGVTRDGGGYEGPGYDKIKFNYIAVGMLMEELRALHPDLYSETEYPNILADPKARQLYEFFINTMSLGFFDPPVGDAGGARLRPGFIPRRYYAHSQANYVDGFRLFGDPRYAKALLGTEDKMPQIDLFEPSIEEAVRQAAALPEADIKPRTRLLDHYGFAYLNEGEPGLFEREACINYTALRGHQQYDYLSLYLFAHEMSHLPDLGYPFGWNYRWQWDSNIYAHNTVAVDGTTPLYPHLVPRGWVSLIGDAAGVQVTAAAHQPYRYDAELEPAQPKVQRYERICVMVSEDERDSYLLDLFVVDGGMLHDQSWHSVLRDPVLPDLDWQDQPTGTAAGPDVPIDGKYTNVRGVETQDALCYITDIKRASLSEHAMFEWDYQLSEPAGMRLHLIPVDGDKQLIFGNGRPPSRPADWHLPYVFVRDTGDGQADLSTRFVSVLEPFRSESAPRIHNVTASGTWPLTITVERDNATDTIEINAASDYADALKRGEPRNIGVRVRTESAGKCLRDVAFGEMPTDNQSADSQSANRPGIVRGQILAIDRGVNTITIPGRIRTHTLSRPNAPRWIRIFSEGRSSMYEILKSRVDGDSTVLTLKETALLGRGIPVGYLDGRIDNDICLPFATGRVGEDGELHDFACRFAGAVVENEDASVALKLRGINGAGWINGERDYDLYLRDQLPAQKLEEFFGALEDASRFTIYDYGVGDNFEITFTRVAAE